MHRWLLNTFINVTTVHSSARLLLRFLFACIMYDMQVANCQIKRLDYYTTDYYATSSVIVLLCWDTWWNVWHWLHAELSREALALSSSSFSYRWLLCNDSLLLRTLMYLLWCVSIHDSFQQSTSHQSYLPPQQHFSRSWKHAIWRNDRQNRSTGAWWLGMIPRISTMEKRSFKKPKPKHVTRYEFA